MIAQPICRERENQYRRASRKQIKALLAAASNISAR